MKTTELKVKSNFDFLELEIVEKGDAREFQKFGNPGKVCNAKGKDEAGSVSITLWNEQVDQVQVGQKVRIDNGFVSEWQGEKQVSTGRGGTIKVL
ncbi:MAG: SOSS complex subunit B family protein [Nanoarchaeota archaeon]